MPSAHIQTCVATARAMRPLQPAATARQAACKQSSCRAQLIQACLPPPPHPPHPFQPRRRLLSRGRRRGRSRSPTSSTAGCASTGAWRLHACVRACARVLGSVLSECERSTQLRLPNAPLAQRKGSPSRDAAHAACRNGWEVLQGLVWGAAVLYYGPLRYTPRLGLRQWPEGAGQAAQPGCWEQCDAQGQGRLARMADMRRRRSGAALLCRHPPRRPRAGRIEEEVRLQRSVELVGQRRRVELHLKAQSKAVKAQAVSPRGWGAGSRVWGRRGMQGGGGGQALQRHPHTPSQACCCRQRRPTCVHVCAPWCRPPSTTGFEGFRFVGGGCSGANRSLPCLHKYTRWHGKLQACTATHKSVWHGH